MNDFTPSWKNEIVPTARTTATVAVWLVAQWLLPDVDGLVGEALVDGLVLIVSAVLVSLAANLLLRGPRFYAAWDHGGVPVEGVVGPIVVNPGATGAFFRVRITYAESRWVAKKTKQVLKSGGVRLELQLSPSHLLTRALVDQKAIRGHKLRSLNSKEGFYLDVPAGLVPGEVTAAKVELAPDLSQGPADVRIISVVRSEALGPIQRRLVRKATSASVIRFILGP